MKLSFITLLSVIGIFVIAGALPAEAQRGDFVRPFELVEDGVRFLPQFEEMRPPYVTNTANREEKEQRSAARVLKENHDNISPEVARDRQVKMRQMNTDRAVASEVFKAQARERLVAGERAALTPQNRPLISTTLRGTFTRLDNMMAQLQRTEDRIRMNLIVQAGNGKDVSEAEAALEEASAIVKDAAAIIVSTQETLIDAVENETEISRETVRELMTIARDAVLASHRALVDVIRIIKQS